MSRREDILTSFFQNDRIWPPFVASTPGHVFVVALVDVLERLPDDAYDAVESYACFVVADPTLLAVKVPFERTYPAASRAFKVRFETIVFFERTLSLPREAFVGLIAHELAHSLQSFPDYETDEREADALVIRWGFESELCALRSFSTSQSV